MLLCDVCGAVNHCTPILKDGFWEKEHPLKQALRRRIGVNGCDFVMSLSHPVAAKRANAPSALQSVFLSASPQPAAAATPGTAVAAPATSVGSHSTAAAMQPCPAAEPSSPADSASSMAANAANVGEQTVALQPDMASIVDMPCSGMQGDLTDDEGPEAVRHVPCNESCSPVSLPCTTAAANSLEVGNAPHEIRLEVAQQSRSSCGQTDAQTDSDGMCDAVKPPDSKIMGWRLVKCVACGFV